MELDNVLHSSDVQDSPLVASMTNANPDALISYSSSPEANKSIQNDSNSTMSNLGSIIADGIISADKYISMIPKSLKKAIGPLQSGLDLAIYSAEEKESHPNQSISTTLAVGASQASGVSVFSSIGMAAGGAVGYKVAESLTNFMPQPAGALAKLAIIGSGGLIGSYIASTAYEDVKINDKGSVHDNVGNFARDNSSSFASWAKDMGKSITSIFTSRDTQATNCNSNAVGCVADGSLQNYRHSDHEIDHGGGGHAHHFKDCTKDNSCGNKTHEACKDGDKGCKIGGGLSHDLSRDNDSEHEHDIDHDVDTSDHDSSHDIDHDVDNDNDNDD